MENKRFNHNTQVQIFFIIFLTVNKFNQEDVLCLIFCIKRGARIKGLATVRQECITYHFLNIKQTDLQSSFNYLNKSSLSLLFLCGREEEVVQYQAIAG
jgi:hypothetical protein